MTDGGTILDDALSYDIFSQAGQAVMSPVGVDPLGGLEPERILASGASQSAGRLVIYHNSIQPLANLFDAFFLSVGGGTVRTDLGVPVFKLQSETEAIFIALRVRIAPAGQRHPPNLAGSRHGPCRSDLPGQRRRQCESGFDSDHAAWPL